MLYIHFFHGRKDPEEELNDWGSDGPIVKISAISWTYGWIKFYSMEDENVHHIILHRDDLVPIGDTFYGDFEVIEEDDEWMYKEIHDKGRELMTFQEFIKLNKTK